MAEGIEVIAVGARRRLRLLFGTWSGRLLVLGTIAVTFVAAVVLPPELFPIAALLTLLAAIIWTDRLR